MDVNKDTMGLENGIKAPESIQRPSFRDRLGEAARRTATTARRIATSPRTWLGALAIGGAITEGASFAKPANADFGSTGPSPIVKEDTPPAVAGVNVETLKGTNSTVTFDNESSILRIMPNRKEAITALFDKYYPGDTINFVTIEPFQSMSNAYLPGVKFKDIGVKTGQAPDSPRVLFKVGVDSSHEDADKTVTTYITLDQEDGDNTANITAITQQDISSNFGVAIADSLAIEKGYSPYIGTVSKEAADWSGRVNGNQSPAILISVPEA